MSTTSGNGSESRTVLTQLDGRSETKGVDQNNYCPTRTSHRCCCCRSTARWHNQPVTHTLPEFTITSTFLLDLQSKKPKRDRWSLRFTQLSSSNDSPSPQVMSANYIKAPSDRQLLETHLNQDLKPAACKEKSHLNMLCTDQWASLWFLHTYIINVYLCKHRF